MTKKIAVINDLSGFGRCSLTAAISAISVMGVQPCPLPTAILSAQTGYPSYYWDDYTDRMEYFRQEWEKMDVDFDGIYTGFVANEAQIAQIFRFLDTFYKRDTFLLVDPVMGDEGKVYKIFTTGLLQQMRKLVMRSDVITPNLTELCLLTDTAYAEAEQETDQERLQMLIEKRARKLIQGGPKTVVVTGIRLTGLKTGTPRIGNLAVNREQSKWSVFPYVGGSFSGTGDLFASILAGGIARGDDIFQVMELAGTLIARAMQDSVRENVERNAGTNYEKYLGMLL